MNKFKLVSKFLDFLYLKMKIEKATYREREYAILEDKIDDFIDRMEQYENNKLKKLYS